ncbi:MAG: 1-deoxy-D-xylulose-5-phosphate synthase [Bacilli bacterium]|nr:1-deoxy-D-xylulose-5-phosphate synthase [Bacilli bacterium]
MKKKADIERIDIKSIKDPAFVKTLNRQQLQWLCEDIRTEILASVSSHGGHLSSNLGVVELTVALHRSFDFPKDKLIFDVGHQSYTHKVLTGRDLETLNCPGGIAGFQKIRESEYDPYEAGHSSNSISAAEAFAVTRDQKKENRNIIAVVGDASIVNGLAFEAMNDVGGRGNKIIIILNDNGMSISKSVGGAGQLFRALSAGKVYNRFKRGFRKAVDHGKAGHALYDMTYHIKQWFKRTLIRTNLFDAMGFSYLGPIDGHDIRKMERAFAKAKTASKSIVIHVRTKKGKGYPYAEKDETGYWHGVTPFDIETGTPKNRHDDYVSWSHVFADLTMESMKKHENAYLVTPATLKGAGLDEVFDSFPERTRDVGIAEEHATTFSGALALNGYHPILSIYSTFLQRAYDELSHDCARLGINMTLLIDRAGLVGKDGDTHQGIYDVAFLRSIPNTVVAMPSNKAEARFLYEESFGNHGVFAIRLPREFVRKGENEADAEYAFGESVVLRQGSTKRLAVVAVGPKAEELKKKLDEADIDVTLINPLFLCPLGQKQIDPLLGYEAILVYDAYGIEEGFASELLLKLNRSGYSGSVEIHAIPKVFVAGAEKEDQEKQFGLTVDDIAERIRERISEK